MKLKIFYLMGLFGLWANASQERVEALLRQSINRASNIAMQERLNLTNIPSNLTIITQETILYSGARTLFEALQLIPGIGKAMSASGKRQIILRGERGKYRDKIKLFIDGVDVTNDLHSNQFYYYNFPAALIKRIELSKTPDAILHGSNAFLGVINVVTHKADHASFLRLEGGSENDRTISLYDHWRQGSLLLEIQAYRNHQSPSILASPTALVDLIKKDYTIARPTLPIDASERSYGASVRLSLPNWHLAYRYQSYKKGNFFGVSNLPPLRHDRSVTLRHQTIDLAYNYSLGRQLKGEARLIGTDYRWQGAYRAFSYTLLSPDHAISNDPLDDLIMGATIHERKATFQNEITYESDHHHTVAQLSLSHAKPLESPYYQWIDRFGPQPKRTQTVLKKEIACQRLAVALEEIYAPFDSISFIGGLRYDHYSDFNNHLSFKGGVLLHPWQKQTFKLLFNHAFRAPSWVELYASSASQFIGNPQLKPETIDMFEAIWLYNVSDNLDVTLSAYIGENSDAIIRDETDGSYANSDGLILQGAEGVFTYHFDRGGQWVGSFSYVEHHNSHFKHIEVGTSKLYLRSWLDWPLTGHWRSFTKIAYRDAIKNLPHYVHDIASCTTVDQTLTFKKGDWLFQIGIKNLFDQKNDYLVLPAHVGSFLIEPINGTIHDIGRQWFIAWQVAW